MPDITPQQRSALHAAAFQPSKRAELLSQLQMDPAFRAAAQHEYTRLIEGQRLGRLLDRDHISKLTHDMLGIMLPRLAASESGISVE